MCDECGLHHEEEGHENEHARSHPHSHTHGEEKGSPVLPTGEELFGDWSLGDEAADETGEIGNGDKTNENVPMKKEGGEESTMAGEEATHASLSLPRSHNPHRLLYFIIIAIVVLLLTLCSIYYAPVQNGIIVKATPAEEAGTMAETSKSLPDPIAPVTTTEEAAQETTSEMTTEDYTLRIAVLPNPNALPLGLIPERIEPDGEDSEDGEGKGGVSVSASVEYVPVSSVADALTMIDRGEADGTLIFSLSGLKACMEGKSDVVLYDVNIDRALYLVGDETSLEMLLGGEGKKEDDVEAMGDETLNLYVPFRGGAPDLTLRFLLRAAGYSMPDTDTAERTRPLDANVFYGSTTEMMQAGLGDLRRDPPHPAVVLLPEPAATIYRSKASSMGRGNVVLADVQTLIAEFIKVNTAADEEASAENVRVMLAEAERRANWWTSGSDTSTSTLPLGGLSIGRACLGNEPCLAAADLFETTYRREAGSLSVAGYILYTNAVSETAGAAAGAEANTVAGYTPTAIAAASKTIDDALDAWKAMFGSAPGKAAVVEALGTGRLHYIPYNADEDGVQTEEEKAWHEFLRRALNVAGGNGDSGNDFASCLAPVAAKP